MTLDRLQERLGALLPEGVRVDGFLRYRDDVLRFNQGRNLVSREGGAELVERLILESAAAALVLPAKPEDRILDLGTGAGFPGIPFALARPAQYPMVLLDRRPVACDFLRRELVELGLAEVGVLEGQSKELLIQEDGLSGGFRWVLMKAVAPPREALALARPFLADGGCAVIFRDQAYAPEPKILSTGKDGTPLWSWEGGLPLPGFEPRHDSPALQIFRRLG